jgi:cytochrome P450
MLLLSHPDHVQEVLVQQADRLAKDQITSGLSRILGEGLLTSEGATWKRQRKLAAPSFSRADVAVYGQAMGARGAALADEITRTGGGARDVHADMTRVTLDVVVETLFAREVPGVGSLGDTVGELLTAFRRAFIGGQRLLPDWVPTASRRTVWRTRRQIDELLLGVIQRARAGDVSGPDLLSMLIEARDAETGEAMDDRQLRDEAMTIFLAGHETTANALTFSWLLLSRYPAAYRELRAEVTQALGGRSPGVDDLARLSQPRRVVQEAMRLYPPAWIIGRSTNEPDEIGGYEIPARSIVFVSPYVIHRHPGLWENPEGFDPGRFATEPPRGAYLPFGAGPRMCIGNGFAMMEAELVLATLAQRLRFDLVPGEPVKLEPSITLRPRHGIQMRVV